jgi:hypothetical protein
MVTNEKIFKSLLGLSEIGHNKCPKTKSQKYFWEIVSIFKESLKKRHYFAILSCRDPNYFFYVNA